MHVDASNQTNAVGRNQTRLVSFNADQLIVSSQRSKGPLGSVKLTWKQAN
jgi:hypothetical protein